MRRLGVDPGSVRIGLALSDEDGVLASPLATVDARGKGAPDEVARRAREAGVVEIVVGLPLTLAGREGEASRRARALGARVEALSGVPVVYWDERFTTAEATRALAASGVRGEKRRGLVDRAAATVLLQSYLDARANDRDGRAGDFARGPSGR